MKETVIAAFGMLVLALASCAVPFHQDLYGKATEKNPSLQVTYNGNGATGSPPVDSNEYAPGATVTVLDNTNATPLANTTLVFGGWNTSASGGASTTATGTYYAPGQTLAIARSVTLYAVWLNLSTLTSFPAGLKNIVIPAGASLTVSSTFPYSPFAYDNSITSVTWQSASPLPENAFFDDPNLTTVSISNATSIGTSAFETCTGLTSVTISSSVTSIGQEAFVNCSSLTSITIPAGCTSIFTPAFGDDPNLTTINIAPGNTAFTIINGALCNAAGTTLVTVPSGMTGNFAIPPGITAIAGYAFEGCAHLSGITFNSNLTTMARGRYVFTEPIPSLLPVRAGDCPADRARVPAQYPIENEMWGLRIPPQDRQCEVKVRDSERCEARSARSKGMV